MFVVISTLFVVDLLKKKHFNKNILASSLPVQCICTKTGNKIILCDARYLEPASLAGLKKTLIEKIDFEDKNMSS